ncbi:MAG: putative membrane protein [Maribacter sp.]|jgi:putative membrane protein
MKNWSEKTIKIVVWSLTVVVLGLIVLTGFDDWKIPLPDGVDLGFLPVFHSTMNALVAICLIAALVFIKKKDVKNHQRAIYCAMTFSALFLLSYVAHHATGEPIGFGGEGAIRVIYFTILNTHILLAGVVFPFILFTFIRGYRGEIDKHRKLAKKTFPIWLYVAITGPLVYLMLAFFQ